MSAAPAASPGWTLETLLPALAARDPVRMRFAERHFVAILEQPIDTTGELRFSPPDRLEKRSLGPRSERLVLDGQTLTIERDGLRRSVDLASVPEAAALAQGLRAVLNGDAAALKRDFSVRVDGTRARWTLELVPRQASVARLIEHIRIGGEHGEVSTIDVQQSSGDRSVMRVSRER